MTETDLLFAIRQALVATGHVMLFRNNVGFDRERKVKYGLGLGSPDLVGLLRPTGRLCGFEVKTPIGRVSKDQKLWHAAARASGGFVAIVRSADEALEALTRARNGALE